MKQLSLFTYMIVLLITPFIAGHAFAGEVTFDSDHSATVDEVVNALKPDDTQDMKLRGINYKPQMPEPKMISVTLQFEKNSYELNDVTKKNLSMIGKALSSDDLKTYKFILEGHADASGEAAHNLTLSQKRAESVKQYLVNSCNVKPDTLKVIGKGEQDPLDASDPYSIKNRRVRIITNQ